MKKYLLVNEYENMNDCVVYKQYVVIEAETSRKAVFSDLKDDLSGTSKNTYDFLVDSGLLKKSTVDIREMQGDETIGDNLVYDILEK